MQPSGGGRPRLCFIGWGDHVHVERWASWFAHAGWPVSIVSFSGAGRYPAGVRQYRVGLQGRGPRWIHLKLRFLLARIRPDIVHVHWAHFAVPVRRAWNGPLVVSAWGSDVYERDNFSEAEWTSLGTALRASDVVTCDSDDLAATIVRELDVARDRVAVIQWGVDTKLFSPVGDDLRTAFGLHGRRVVLSARNFLPLYNQEAIVEAFARVYRARPQAFLLMKNFGGDASYVDAIRAAIRARGLDAHCRIVETMPYEHMPALYRTADVTVSVPFFDATPMALLEAMASGSIPIVSDLPSLREWVVPGRTGFLVDPRDVDALAAALNAALTESAHAAQMRGAARELVVARASQDAHMSVAAAHYTRLGGRR